MSNFLQRLDYDSFCDRPFALFKRFVNCSTGGENTHHSPVFVENLALPQENLFEMIRLATASLADIKSSLQPKIYAEMMTIRLAEVNPELSLSGAVESEISVLRQEIARLKQELANVGTVPKPTSPVPTRPAASKTVYRVDRNKVQSILQEAVENPDLARQKSDSLAECLGRGD